MADGVKIAYGLDESAGRLTLARVVPRGVPQTLLAVDPHSEEAARALQSVAREVEKGIAVLAVCAPAAQTVVRQLRAPFASIQKAARIWPSVLDVELPFPVESAVCFYSDARIENGGTLALASAIRKSELTAFDETCRTAGFNPTHCDAEVLALWSQQGIEAPPARSQLPRALVWLGMDHVAVVRGQGTKFMAAHVLRASPLADSPEKQQAFETLWKARAQQILATHLAETSETEMDLWWAGPGAEDEERAARLRRLLPVDIACRHEIHRQPSSFLARALARRALEGTGVNFKQGDLIHPALLRTQEKSLSHAYLGVIAAAVLVLMLNAGDSFLRQHRAESLQRQLTLAAQAIAGENVVLGQEELMVARAISRRDEETQPFRNALDARGVEGRLADALAEAAAMGVEISHLALSPGTLTLDGSATSIQSIEGLSERLREQGWVVQSDSPGRTPEGRQQFILKGTVRHEG